MFNHNREKKLKFSIRKFSVGVGSVVIGALLFLSPQVLADETGTTTTTTSEVSEKLVATSDTTAIADTTPASESSQVSSVTNSESSATNEVVQVESETAQAVAATPVASSAVSATEASTTAVADTTDEAVAEASTPVAAVAPTTSASVDESVNYSTSGEWTLQNPYPSSNQYISNYETDAYKSAQTTVVKEDGSKVTVTATVVDSGDNPEGMSYLVPGSNQSSYGATADMFYKVEDAAQIPALGIFTQPAVTEGNGNLEDKLNFSGKAESSIFTLTFSEEVTNPIIDFSGIGGSTSFTYVTETNPYPYGRGSFNSTYFELLTDGVTLEKASEGVNLTVTSNSIETTKKNNYYRSVLDEDIYSGGSEAQMPSPEPAGTGSVVLKGTFKTVSFRLYHEATPFTEFPTSAYNTGTDYFANNYPNTRTSVPSDSINGGNKHWSDITNYIDDNGNEGVSNDDKLRFSVRLANIKGNVIVNYIDTEGNVIGTEYKDSTDVAVGTAYNTAETAGDVDSTATVERPATITKDGKTYELVAEETAATVGTVNADGSLATNNAGFTFGTDAAAGEVAEGTKSVTYVYKLKEEPKGSVIVNYIDTEGNVIGTEYKDSTEVAVGTAYNTAETAGDVDSTATVERPATITKDGKTYELVAEETAATVGTVNADGSLATNNAGFTFGTDAATGEVAEGTKSVTYVYKEVVKTGNVVARYVIEGTETEISDDKSVKTEAPVDEAYNDEAPAEITGKDGKVYVLSTTAPVRQNDGDAPTNGTVTEETQTITYQYVLKTTEKVDTVTKEGNVVVHYVTEDGQTLQADVEDTAKTVIETTTTTSQVDSDGQVVGDPVVTTEKTDVAYDTAADNKPAEITVDGKTYILVGTAVEDASGQTQLVDGKVVTADTTAEEQGNVVEGTTEITYVYKLKEEPATPTGNVVARYVIEGTETEIADDKSVKTDAPVDEAYSDEAPAEITGKDGKVYVLSTTAPVRQNDGDAPTNGTVTEETQTITYQYVLKTTEKVDTVTKEGNVVVHYVTEDGQTLQADVEDTAKTVIETTTTTSQVDSDGQVVGDPVVTTEKTDVAYDTAVDNKPAEITVDGKTYVLVGTAVEDASGQTQLVDGKVVTAGTTAEEQGNVVEGTTEITYVYKLKEEPKGRVNAHYVLVNTDTKLADDKVVKPESPVGEEYSDKAPASLEKDGKRYELVGTRTNDGDAPAAGTVKEGTQDITYEYTEVPKGRVIVDYVIQGTDTKLQDTYTDTPTAYIRDKDGNAVPYNTAENGTEKPTVIEKDGVKYELVGVKAGSDAEEGTLREGEQHVTYEYRKVEEAKGSVVVNYVDTEGNVIGTEYKDSTEVAVGTAYNTAETAGDVDSTATVERPATITKDGKTYELVAEETDATVGTVNADGSLATNNAGFTFGTDAATGEVAEGTKSVTYVYKEVVKKGNVVARYVIEGTETEIADDKSVKTDAPVDEAYSDEAPAEITGKDGKVYVLSTTAPVRQNDGDAPTNGTVTEETQTITYQYVLKTTEKVDTVTKEGNVVVHYVTEDGQTLQADVEDTAKTVIETTTTTSQVDSDGQVVGDPVVTTEKTDVAYDTAVDNKPSEITVDGKTYVLVGTAVEDASGQTQLVDGKVVTADTTAEEQGNVVEGTTEITYVYKLKEEPATPTGNVVARYVIEGTETEIADDKSVKTEAPVDEAYSDEAPAEITKDGVTYELVRTRTNDGDAPSDGTVTETTQTITYEYKVKETPATPTGNVVARYVIEGTETEIADDKSVKTEAPVDEAYNDEAPAEITGKDGKVYVLSTTAPVRQNDGDAPTNGTVTEATQTITYQYVLKTTEKVDTVTKEGNVVVHYVTEDGQTLQADVEDTAKTVIETTTTTSQVDSDGQVVGDPVVTTEKTDVAYDTAVDNKPAEITVDGKTYVLVGTAVEDASGQTQLVDGKVVTADTTAEEQGNVVEGTTEITYVYKLKEEPATPTGNVVARYVIEGTETEIADDKSVKTEAPVDEAYNDEAPAEITKDGVTYELVRTRTNDGDAPANGNVTEATQTITYEYKVKATPATPTGNVVARYVIEGTETEIADDKSVKTDAPVDEAYNDEAPAEITGKDGKVYVLSTTAPVRQNDGDAPTNGTVTEATQTITYQYVLKTTEKVDTVTKEGNVVVHYVTEDGQTLQADVEDTAKTVIETTTTTSQVDSDGQVVGDPVVTTEKTDVAYDTAADNKPSEITVDGKTYVLVGTAVEDASGQTQLVDGKVVTADTTAEEQGNVVEGTTEITYVYKLKEEAKGSVIVNYVDTEGNVIGTEYKDTTDAAVGTSYNTAESAGDVDSTATVERPATITKDGKTYELVAEATTATVGTVNADGTLASNAGSFTYGTDAASGEVAEGTKSVTYVYKEVVKTGNVTARYVIEGTETEIADDKSVKTDAPVDEAYSDQAPAEITKDGVTYELVRTRANEGDAPADGTVTEATQTITYEYKVKETPATPTGNVVVNYVDESGNVIKNPVVDTPSSDVDTPYDTTDNKPTTIEFNGKTYELVPTKTVGNETGTVVEGTTEVTYVYKEVVKTGNVVARYVIEGTETEIADDKSVKTDAPVDEAYSDEAPAEITKDGVTYELVRTRANEGDAPADGTVTEATQTITYEYKVKETPATPTGNVVARYVIEGTETEIADDKSVKTDAPVDEAYSDQAPAEITKEGVTYELVRTRANEGDAPADGTVTEAIQTITYEYKVKETPATPTGNVVVNYVDESGNVIKDPVVDTPSSDVDTPYDTTDNKPITIEFNGKTYELVPTKTVGNETGTVVEGTTEVTYVYKEVVKTGNVTARYVIEGTETEIADGKSVKTDAPVDEAYSDEAPAEITKDGVTYELVRTRANEGDAPADGTVTEATQTITYEYKVKETPATPTGNVVVNYVDESGNVIKDPVVDTPTSDVDTPYDTTDNKPMTIEFDGKTYEIIAIKTIGQESGKVVEGTTTITYVYREVVKEAPTIPTTPAQAAAVVIGQKTWTESSVPASSTKVSNYQASLPETGEDQDAFALMGATLLATTVLAG
ncbi:uncharacterized protein YerC/poly(3-hydroxyalkanoate) synthetase, partial [Streptococcus loxodontisalivarius]